MKTAAATGALIIVSLSVVFWFGWMVHSIHACERHDACDDAPAVIREGLAELQTKDPDKWCPPSPAGCRCAGRPRDHR